MSDTQKKYQSRAANIYREKILKLAVEAMKKHGTEVYWNIKDVYL